MPENGSKIKIHSELLERFKYVKIIKCRMYLPRSNEYLPKASEPSVRVSLGVLPGNAAREVGCVHLGTIDGRGTIRRTEVTSSNKR